MSLRALRFLNADRAMDPSRFRSMIPTVHNTVSLAFKSQESGRARHRPFCC